MSETKPAEETVIVGLGNPDSEYEDTRHNLGFDCVRALATRYGVDARRKRWRSLVGHSETHRAWFVLPQTYMNLSGDAVKAALRDVGVAPDRVWVGIVRGEVDGGQALMERQYSVEGDPALLVKLRDWFPGGRS